MSKKDMTPVQEICNNLVRPKFEPFDNISNFFRKIGDISRRGNILLIDPAKSKKIKFNISQYIDNTLSKTRIIYMHDMLDIPDVNVEDSEAKIFTTSKDVVESIIKLSEVSAAIPTIPLVVGNRMKTLGFKTIQPDSSKVRDIMEDLSENSSLGYITTDIEIGLHQAIFKGINVNGTTRSKNYKYNTSTDGIHYKLGPYVIYVPELIMMDDLNRLRDDNPLKFNLLLLVCPSPKRVVNKALYSGDDCDLDPNNGVNGKLEEAFFKAHCNDDISGSSLNEAINNACADLHFSSDPSKKKDIGIETHMRWYKSKLDMIYEAELLDVAAKLKCKTLLIDTSMTNAKYPDKTEPSQYDLNKEWQTLIDFKSFREPFESIIFTGVTPDVDYKTFQAVGRLC